MRKIEQQMIQAIRNKKNWHKGNTRVEVCDNVIMVKLHGHDIAAVSADQIIFDCCGYETNTTRSRLNAVASLCTQYIGFNIIQFSMHFRKGSPNAKPIEMRGFVNAWR